MKRLFTTATPRYYGKSVKSAAEGRGVEIIGMDDERKFGPVLHKLTFGQAIELDMLTDYQVVVVGVDEPMVRDWIADGEIISTGKDHITDARTLAAKIAVLKAIKDYDLTRVISFHGNIKRAKDFAQEVEQVSEIIDAEQRPSGKIWSAHVDGTMSAGKRRDLINNLKGLDGFDVGLLTNARCLSEGVDVPSLDGIAFVDPRGSQVDIIQAVGRAIRKSDNKAKGTIVLPVFLEAGDDPDTVIDASNFKPVWDVLKALRAHDEILATTLDQLRLATGRKVNKNIDHIDKVVIDLPLEITPDFAAALRAELVDATTQSWYFWFGLLEKYIESNGDAKVPSKYVTEQGFKLGSWCDTQRVRYKGQNLETARFNALDELRSVGWVWSLFDFQREQNIRAIKRFYDLEGHVLIKDRYIAPGGENLGAVAKSFRQAYNSGTLEKKWVVYLEKELKFKWNLGQFWWLEQYKALRRWYVKNPYSSPSRSLRVQIKVTERYSETRNLAQFQQSLITSFNWHSGKRGRSGRSVAPKRLTEKQILAIERIPNWSWSRRKDEQDKWRAVLRDFLSTNNVSVLKSETIHKGYAIGRKIAKLRSKNRKKPLPSHELDFLTEMGINLDPFQQQWEHAYNLLLNYVEEHETANVTQSTFHEGFKLGAWVSTQRQSFKEDKLTKERIERLSKLKGWVWFS